MPLKMDIVANDRFFTNTDFQINVHVYQNDEVAAQDITGWDFSWFLKRRKDDLDANALLAKTNPTGIDLTSPSTGDVRVLIVDDDIDATIKGGTYWHELKRTGPGVETVLLQGLAVLQSSLHLS